MGWQSFVCRELFPSAFRCNYFLYVYHVPQKSQNLLQTSAPVKLLEEKLGVTGSVHSRGENQSYREGARAATILKPLKSTSGRHGQGTD